MCLLSKTVLLKEERGGNLSTVHILLSEKYRLTFIFNYAPAQVAGRENSKN